MVYSRKFIDNNLKNLYSTSINQYHDLENFLSMNPCLELKLENLIIETPLKTFEFCFIN